MLPVVVSVLVDASLQRVWDDLTNLETHPNWMADAVAVGFPAGRRSGPGTVMEVDTRIGPFRLTDWLTVTVWDPPHTMAVDHHGLVRGTGRFDLDPVAGGVRLTWREDLRFPWWLGGALTGLLASPVLARIWRGNLRRFRRKVEASLNDP